MADRYQRLTAGGPGGFLAKRLGLPRPEPLRRHRPGTPVVNGPVVTGGSGGGRLGGRLASALDSLGAPVRDTGHGGPEAGAPARPAVGVAGAAAGVARPAAGSAAGSGSGTGTALGSGAPPHALVFDATGISDSTRLRELHAFFHPRIRSLAPHGRVVVLGTPPEAAGSVAEATAQRALEGFVRSVGKELRRGACAHLLLVAPGAEEGLESPLRFALSARSAYVSGQTLHVSGATPPQVPEDWDRPLAGRTALVTGASRGIGAVVAETLARDGAQVVCLDVPGQVDELRAVARQVGGSSARLDVTAPDAGDRLARELRDLHGGVDVVVHNAGITRDRTLGRMDADRWDAALTVNLTAVERLTARLLADDCEAGEDGPVLRDGGRIVCTSSIAGIAGNVGQTNYAASKAGLIGYVQALAPEVAGRGITVNAVAPGFIETRMTAAVPLFVREAGRRMNSHRQGGQPVDVAEAVAFFASPASNAVTGQVLRVCGQSLLGA